MQKRHFIPAAAIAIAAVVTGGIVLLAPANNSGGLWHNPAVVATGATIYTKNCLSCHGVSGVGTKNWRQRGEDGSFPPPPLNGTAHTWHHPLAVLQRTIKQGGVPLGGKMPAFGDKLTDEEIDAVIAYIQSQWPEQTRQTWAQNTQKQ